MSKRVFGFLGSPGLNVAPPVADPVYVDIYADPGLSISDGHHEIGRLAADAFQRQEFFDGIRHPSSKVLKKALTNRPNLSGFVFVEAHRIDGFLYRSDGERAHVLRRVG